MRVRRRVRVGVFMRLHVWCERVFMRMLALELVILCFCACVSANHGLIQYLYCSSLLPYLTLCGSDQNLVVHSNASVP